jgi:hypothetical protein
VQVFEGDDEDSSQEQGPQHHVRRAEEERLDYPVEGQAQDARGEEGDDKFFHRLEIHEQATPVEGHHGEDGADLDGDLEALEELRVAEPHQLGGEDQVSRGRDGQ